MATIYAMKNYFISLDGRQEGPFSLEELKTKNLSNNHLIWQNGYENWKSINEAEELDEYILRLPPPLEQNKVIKDSKENYKYAMVIITTILSFTIFIKAGGTEENEFIFENYIGNKYYDGYIVSRDHEVMANRIRLFIGGASLLTGAVFGMLVYYYGMMRTYKSAYKKQL